MNKELIIWLAEEFGLPTLERGGNIYIVGEKLILLFSKIEGGNFKLEEVK